MQKGKPQHASWQELLAAPRPASHIAQIYESDAFLVACVSLFAAEGVRRGDAVLLAGTPHHLRAIRGALAGRDVDVHAAVRQGQLQFHDVHEAVSAILPDGALDAARFEAAVVEGLASASADVRFYGVRWWGEISNVLHHAGSTRAALAAEELAGAAGRKHDICVLCSYLCDKFDSRSYDGILPEVCRRHSHVIPTDDYVRHRLAVNRAIADVIGEIRSPLLQSLLAWEGQACDLPSSQELLFWLREAQPERFPEVLSRARAHH